MRNVLITGIEPFDNEILNPSWEAARALDGERIGDAVLHARQLPCVLATVQQSLLDAIAQVEPDVVLCLGQASGRPDISIERVAINIVDARIPDNAGAQPIDEPVVPGGPVAYFSTLPIKALMRALRQSGIPASISQTAGTYNCNAIFYALEHHIATHRPHVRGGFIHVPYLPEMAVRHPGAPSLALDVLIRAVRIMAKTALALSAQQDLKIGAGAVQ